MAIKIHHVARLTIHQVVTDDGLNDKGYPTANGAKRHEPVEVFALTVRKDTLVDTVDKLGDVLKTVI